MTDIAKRLRAWADPVEQGYEVPAAGQAMRDGADEIERLRAALCDVLDAIHGLEPLSASKVKRFEEMCRADGDKG